MNWKLFVIVLCAAMLPGIAIEGHDKGKGNRGRDVEESRDNRGRGDNRGREDDHDRRDDRDNRHDRDRADDRANNRQRAADNRRASVALSSRHREIIRDFFRNRQSNLPPGLAKRGDNLPPGLQKQLKRNGTLPPGLQKRLEPVPQDLQKSLPPLATGLSWGTIGQDVVIVDNRTHRIIDIIRDIASRR